MQRLEVKLAVITNARFIDIGNSRQVVGGTLNGATFYTSPIIEIDGDVVRTAEGSFRFFRSIQ